MVSKRTYDREGNAHFVTFSYYRRRRLLDHGRPRKVVLGVLNSQPARQDGRCVGFVIMPDHVHAIVWFVRPDRLSHFMKQGKQRSSARIKRLAQIALSRYDSVIDLKEPFWQAGYDDFNLNTDAKLMPNSRKNSVICTKTQPALGQ